MFTYEIAPLAAMIELELINKLCGLVGEGMKDASGVMTTGGSNGNMIGLLCARQNKFPDTVKKGSDGRQLCVFTSEECHYSTLMAANVLGLGYDNVIKVGVDQSGCMDMDKLVAKVEEAKAAGKTPLCVVATAGTTVRGQFDPFVKISAVCKKYDMWMHIDAAWGGSCLFSDKLKHLMEGADLTDSMCWDVHKIMGIPLICSFFLTKDVKLLKTICGHSQTAHYLLHADREDLDLGHRSLQCGRRNDALKLWLLWKEQGEEGFAAIVEGYVANADYMESKVKETPKLEMMSARAYANVNYRYNPGKDV